MKKILVYITCCLMAFSPIGSLLARTPSVFVTGYEVPSHEIEIGPNLVQYTYTTAKISEEEELKDVQVPIPREIRSLNHKGSCVWNSMEVLGRYAHLKRVYYITRDVDGSPTQGDRRCQGGSSPSPVRKFLDAEHIKYDMITNGDRNFLVKYCKEQRRGICFDIPGHMLNLVHYDPDTKTVKVIDNADRSLSVQTWTWEKFHRIWGGWAYTIFADDDKVPYYYDPYNKLQIQYNGQAINRKEYFPILPKKQVWFD